MRLLWSGYVSCQVKSCKVPEPMLFSLWLHRGFDLIHSELLQPIASIKKELSIVCKRQLKAICSLIAPVGTLRQMIRKLAIHCRNEEVGRRKSAYKSLPACGHAAFHYRPFLVC